MSRSRSKLTKRRRSKKFRKSRTSKRARRIHSNRYRASSSVDEIPARLKETPKHRRVTVLLIPFQYVQMIQFYHDGDFRRHSGNTRTERRSNHHDFENPYELQKWVERTELSLIRSRSLQSDDQNQFVTLPSNGVPWPFANHIYDGQGNVVNVLFCSARLPKDEHMQRICTELKEYKPDDLIHISFSTIVQTMELRPLESALPGPYIGAILPEMMRNDNIGLHLTSEIRREQISQHFQRSDWSIASSLVPIESSRILEICNGIDDFKTDSNTGNSNLPPLVYREKSNRLSDQINLFEF